MKRDGEFEGAGVVVFGQSQVSLAVADAFLNAGARVVTDRDLKSDVFDAAQGQSPEAVCPKEFFGKCEAAIGNLDVVVLTMPPIKSLSLFDTGTAELREIVEKGLVLPVGFMQEAANRMMKKGAGRIIVIASMSGKTGPHRNVAPFAAAHGGLFAYARVLATEVAASGVTVNGIATARLEDPTSALSEAARQELQRGFPVGRFGRVDEVAAAALYLASQNAGFVTGECMNLSGGRFMD